MGWSKLFKGEPMPDKSDPKYKERYEQAYNAGGKFARATGIAWLGQRITDFANGHKGLFLALVLGFAVCVFLLQTCRFVMYITDSRSYVPVTERVDSALQDRFVNSNQIVDSHE